MKDLYDAMVVRHGVPRPLAVLLLLCMLCAFPIVLPWMLWASRDSGRKR